MVQLEKLPLRYSFVNKTVLLQLNIKSFLVRLEKYLIKNCNFTKRKNNNIRDY